MQTLEPVVASLPLFAGMKEEHLVLIAGCARNIRYEAGEYIGRLGEPADNFWLVREGRVGLEVHTADRGPLQLQTLGVNDVLGWSWLVPPNQWHFDARALTPVRALIIDGKCLRGKFESDYELGYQMMQRFMQIVVERLESTEMQLLDVVRRK